MAREHGWCEMSLSISSESHKQGVKLFHKRGPVVVKKSPIARSEIVPFRPSSQEWSESAYLTALRTT